MMADRDVVEIMRDAAGELSHRLHLLRLREVGFQRALFGRLQQVNDRDFRIARILVQPT